MVDIHARNKVPVARERRAPFGRSTKFSHSRNCLSPTETTTINRQLLLTGSRLII